MLQLLDLADCLVTIDALGTQQSIAARITMGKADYILALKANHATAFEEVRLFLDDWAAAQPAYETVDKAHGRLEVRRYWLSDTIEWFQDAAAWTGLRSFGMVEAHRTLNGQTHTQRRYYLSSLPAQALRRFAQAVRAHWSIENTVHWTLDVTFREDYSRVRKDHAPENLARLRRMTMNLLKQDRTSKGGIKVKRLRAALDHEYLAKVLLQKI